MKTNHKKKPPPPQLKSGKTHASAKIGSTKWLIAALLLLSVIPLVAGAFRLIELASGADITPDNARFFFSPLPIVLHILCSAVFAVLGTFQFAPNSQRRWPSWHRTAGRYLVLSGLLVGGTGLWMTLFYPMPANASNLLYILRLLFGSAMIASLLLGVTSIVRGSIGGHRAWMMRGYAIGLGAGTQVLTLAAGEIIDGPPGETERALLMGAAWVINLAVAEWFIHRRTI